jgi:hypothetical protein
VTAFEWPGEVAGKLDWRSKKIDMIANKQLLPNGKIPFNFMHKKQR